MRLPFYLVASRGCRGRGPEPRWIISDADDEREVETGLASASRSLSTVRLSEVPFATD
jgi:hypothetical protein